MPDSDSDDDLFADSTAETTSNTAALFGVLGVLDGGAEEPQDFAAVLAGAPEAVSLGVGDGGNAGAARLADALAQPVPSVARLDLEGRGVGDTGFAAVAAKLSQLPRLAELFAANNALGASSARALADRQVRTRLNNIE